MDCGEHEFMFPTKYNCGDEILNITLLCRGRAKNCPMAISDFVVLHNKVSEGLVKTDRVGYDIYSGIADMKAALLKLL